MLQFIFFLFMLLYLSFLSANPWRFGHTKYNIYTFIPSKYQLKTTKINYDELNTIKSFPIVIKPIYCNGTGNNVGIIKNKNDLSNYIKKVDKNEEYMVQEYHQPKYEFGLLYEKLPLTKGKIQSLILKENINNKDNLLCKNVDNDGTNCMDRKDLITKELIKAIQEIANNIPKFYAGRFDIVVDNLDDLKKGDFKVYELNGNMGFDLNNNFTDRKLSINNIKKIINQLNWIIKRIIIGFYNIITFNSELYDLFIDTKKRMRYYKRCTNWEILFAPSSA